MLSKREANNVIDQRSLPFEHVKRLALWFVKPFQREM